MVKSARREYLETIRKRYRKARKKMRQLFGYTASINRIGSIS